MQRRPHQLLALLEVALGHLLPLLVAFLPPPLGPLVAVEPSGHRPLASARLKLRHSVQVDLEGWVHLRQLTRQPCLVALPEQWECPWVVV